MPLDKAWFCLGKEAYNVMVTSLGLCLVFRYLLWLPYASLLLQTGAYSEVPLQYGFSVFELSPWKYWGHALLTIGCLSGVVLVFRRYVKIALCIHLIIFSGLIVSVPFSLSADHKIASVLMLWLLLLPTSFDARGYYTGLAVFGLRFQLGLIYFCGTLYKLFDPSWVTGNALLLDPIRKAFRADGFRFSATGGPAYGWQASGFRLPTLPMSRY